MSLSRCQCFCFINVSGLSMGTRAMLGQLWSYQVPAIRCVCNELMGRPEVGKATVHISYLHGLAASSQAHLGRRLDAEPVFKHKLHRCST